MTLKAASATVVPSFTRPVSQFVTASQFDEPRFREMLDWWGWGFGRNRKLWEYLYILNVLDIEGISGKRFLGFGCGREMIPGLLTAKGGHVVATDYAEEADRAGWNWASRGLDELFVDHVLAKGAVRELAEFHHVDMNIIPDTFADFDALWSCGSLEHIGGLQQGLDFVVESMRCLKPGGLAVHTTEFNVSPGEETYESPSLSLYRRHHIDDLVSRLRNDGHDIDVLWTRGTEEIDNYVDHDASYERSIVAEVCGFNVTSIGLIIRKKR